MVAMLTPQKVILLALIWAQTCLVIGIFAGVLSFRDFIAIQVSLIMLLVPSPFVQNKNNDNNGN
jgi:hypothetical protein